MEVVEQFKYLGSLVEAFGGVVGEVSCRIAQASGAIGSLRDSVFTASDLTMKTKRMVYLECCYMVLWCLISVKHCLKSLVVLYYSYLPYSYW